ncbi:hypothetical protein O3M35_003552 [Rhynocoris fuscipes]|uniref:Uncharacterized protein n=1 Tax=Rhynocoris fuscipes TaxID=488301 RepID=A0AAW1CKJ3_9HEMI
MKGRISSAYLFLVLSIFAVGLSESSWAFSNPFEELFHKKLNALDEGPPAVPGPPEPPGVPPPPAPHAGSEPPPPPPHAGPEPPPPPPAVPDSPAASPPKPIIDYAAEMRKIVQEELKKYQSSQKASKPSPPTEPKSNPIPAEDAVDMIRKVIADELSKALTTVPTPAPETSTPPQPVWKSWANTKYWAKKPGPDGQAPPGFIGALTYRFGPADANVGAVHPSGSPGWVWSQIASKWAKEPTAVPPAQVVEKGEWQVVLPPQAAPKN